ncbi:MAG: beta-propeller fold lactonase family protein [Alphaproteobacteria bacterium]|nr:beta-propeller fold lactonase family protein [Alphaproteobacteria bacterium]
MKYVIFYLCFFITWTSFSQNPYRLIVSTYTNNNSSQGIYIVSYNPAKKTATIVSKSPITTNPSFVAWNPKHQLIYAVNENLKGTISVFKYNLKQQQFKLLQIVPSFGSDPCYIKADADFSWLSVANYSGGNFIVYKLKNDGMIDSTHFQTQQLRGSSINTARQESPHCHAAVYNFDNSRLFISDLGGDRILNYPFKASNGLAPLDTQNFQTIPLYLGSGPRHLVTTLDDTYMFVVEELAGFVSVFKKNYYNSYQFLKRYPLHQNFKNNSNDFASADLHLSKNEDFLYVSNRGRENNIAIFKWQKDLENLQFLGVDSVNGLTPRNFYIHDNDTDVWVANQNSNEVVLFQRNHETGRLQNTSIRVSIPAPVCIKLME